MLLIAIIVGSVLAVAISRNTPGRSSGAGLPAHFLVNQPAPDFTLPLLDGGEVKLSSLRGKVVVLDFWATYCPLCVQTMPSTQAIARKFADRGVLIYAVNLGESPARVREFFAEQKTATPVPVVAMDEQTEVGYRYGVQYLPQLFVIDARGIIHAADTSDPADMESRLEQSIESALKAGQAS